MRSPLPAQGYRYVLAVILFSLFFSNSYASEKNKITFCSSEWKPFFYLDDEDQPKGLYYDIVKEIFGKHLGMTVAYQQLPWKRAQYYIAEGLADIFITVQTEERLEYSKASELPALKLFLHVYTYKNHPQIEQIRKITSGKDIKDLGLIPVSNIGNSWHKINIDSYGINTQYVDNEENAFNVLAKKRADLTIEPIYASSYLINKLNLGDRIEPTDARFGPLNFHILFSKKSAHLHLLARTDEIIQQLDENGRLEEITSKYRKIEKGSLAKPP